MTDFFTAIGIAVFGSVGVIALLTFARVARSGRRMADDVARSGFNFKAWLNGALPTQRAGSNVSVAAGIRMRATRKGLKVKPTRTLSREVL
jgi:hypothetical protein